MLLAEAKRKDPHSTDFLESLQGVLPSLAPGEGATDVVGK